MQADDKLIEDFLASFPKLAEMSTSYELDDTAWEFAEGEPDEWGGKQWHPRGVLTDRSALEFIYQKLPARFPPLYEKLVLSYRWAMVDLQTLRLLPNPPGEDLERLLQGILKHKALAETLFSNGYIQFAFAPDVNYDPVCFDTRHRAKDGDCRVVQIDHEEILCNFRLREVAELAPGFRELMLKIITAARET